ncbi:hypothetical protein V6N12_060258 [Hibiscus sabdariffa]|uniref:Endonuclease/exonuclease/phosphatase domain-containing protein n=1 Tax=Hibiscus sabdariffa TaxID=183260 RepID=A0ABR2D6N8_9ROSI
MPSLGLGAIAAIYNRIIGTQYAPMAHISLKLLPLIWFSKRDDSTPRRVASQVSFLSSVKPAQSCFPLITISIAGAVDIYGGSASLLLCFLGRLIFCFEIDGIFAFTAFLMAIVAWNVRGLGNPNTTRALKDAIMKFNPKVVFLSETKKKHRYLERLKTKNRFTWRFYVDPRGLTGGLTLWWTEGISVTILKDSINFIDTLLSLNGEEPWQCTFLYGPPNAADKQLFWEKLHLLRNDPSSKWCIIGDVNIVADQSEKEGGNPINSNQAKWFLDFTDVAGMIELPIKGGNFTWSNMRSNEEAIAERLDKILISGEWSSTFPKAIGILEAAVASNHNPIIIQLQGLKKRRKKDFKFESRWLLEEECFSKVNEAWLDNSRNNSQINLNRNLRHTRVKLQKWSGKKSRTSREGGSKMNSE